MTERAQNFPHIYPDRIDRSDERLGYPCHTKRSKSWLERLIEQEDAKTSSSFSKACMPIIVKVIITWKAA